MSEAQHARSLRQKRSQLERMIELVDEKINYNIEPNPVAEKVKFNLQSELLTVEIELIMLSEV